MKINEKTDRHIHQLHVREKLRLMHRKNTFNRFYFHYQAAIYNRIESEILVERNSFIFNRNTHLISGGHSPQLKLTHQAFFIDLFKETRPFMPVNFNGGAYHLLRPFIRLNVTLMHLRKLNAFVYIVN